MHRVTNIGLLPAQPSAIRLSYSDGTVIVADLRPLADRGGVFVRLRDPSYLSQVRLGEGGRFLEWPDGLDLCVDALRLDAQPRRSAV